MPLKKGRKAPVFELSDQFGKIHKLADYSGVWLVLYFYPKDDTPGCTKEACAIRDDFGKYKRKGVKVIGISADTVKSHNKFAEKYRLPFTLLTDSEKTVIKKYDAWGRKKFMGREYDGILRKTFLINPEGKIEKIYNDVKPEFHSTEILSDLKEMQKDK